MQEKDEQSSHQINRLRDWRNRKDRDFSSNFIKQYYNSHIGRPAKQLARFVEPFEKLVPPNLLPHCWLNGYSRGILRIQVSNASVLFDLDQQLRAGLQKQLSSAAGVNIRKVKLEVKTDGDQAAE